MFKGLYTALITPFSGGKIDDGAFGRLIEWQIAEGVPGLVPCGTTGESPILSHAEHCRVVELCVEAAARKAKVLAGTGSNSTEEAILLTRHAQKVGADGALVVAPYYNKPTQMGIYAHYKAIHDATELPIIIYNIPGRSGINISDATLARLAELPRIAGVKDATGDLARPYTLRARLPSLGKEFALLSGEDMTAVAFNASGGVGCISVTSNVAPRACAEVQNACLAGDFTRALALHDTLVPLHEAMFCETSPGPVKFAASLMGKCEAEWRLPLVEPEENSKQCLRAALSKLGLI